MKFWIRRAHPGRWVVWSTQGRRGTVGYFYLHGAHFLTWKSAIQYVNRQIRNGQ